MHALEGATRLRGVTWRVEHLQVAVAVKWQWWWYDWCLIWMVAWETLQMCIGVLCCSWERAHLSSFQCRHPCQLVLTSRLSV